MITGVIEASSRGIWSRTAAALAVSLALGICVSASLAAQTATTGVVLGKVTDPQGALVAGAEVVLTDTTTNLTRTQRTNDAGLFTFSAVLPGPYTMKVTAAGFRTAEFKAIIVEVNRASRPTSPWRSVISPARSR